MSKSSYPDVEPMGRLELLSIMGITAVFMALIAKAMLYFGQLQLPAVQITPQSIGMGLLLSLGLVFMSRIVYQLWPAYRANSDWYLNLVVRPLAWPDLIWLGLLPGLSEELLFRGVLLPSIGYNWVGVILSALCFGLLHTNSRQQWPYALWASVVGLVLGMALLQTGNLAVPIFAHICCNIFSASLWKWQQRS
jgi:uncharacterized protein